MDKPIVIGLGEFLWDVLPEGKKAGGAPVNFAYHASRHGAQGWAVSAVGKDKLGDELIEAARAHKINLAVSKVAWPTGTVQVSIEDGQPSYRICEAVAWDHIPLTEESLGIARKAEAICFGTLAQRHEDSRRTTRAMVEACPRECLKVYDINLRQAFWSKELISESLEIADVLKTNDEELEVLKGIFGIKDTDVSQVCRFLMRRWDLRYMILTCGSRCSHVFSADETSVIKTPVVDVVDSVGAGDAFTGSFIASLICGRDAEEAHRIAVETAAYVCTQAGAWTE